MSIPPISSPQGTPPPEIPDPAVQEFNQLWNNWYKNPTLENATKLLDFMRANHDHFAEIAKHCPPPPPFVNFENSYRSAISTLTAWIEDGCPIHQMDAPVEFIGDVAKWINYAG